MDERDAQEIRNRTKRALFYARTRELPLIFNRRRFINLWTDRTRWLPVLERSTGPWIEENGRVRQVVTTRWYWLRFGMATVEPLTNPERG